MVRFALTNRNGKRYCIGYGSLRAFLIISERISAFLTMQFPISVKTKNVAAVSHALLHRNRKTVRFSLRKCLFQELNRDKKFRTVAEQNGSGRTLNSILG